MPVVGVAQPSYVDPFQETQFFECPKCKHFEPNTINKFQKDDLDIKHQCRRCHKSSPVKNWNCQCGTKWHVCSLHSNIRTFGNQPPLKKVKVQPNSELEAPTTRQKGFMPPASFENLLAEDQRMELKRKHPDSREEHHSGYIDLGQCMHHEVSPNLLGPILKRRFARM